MRLIRVDTESRGQALERLSDQVGVRDRELDLVVASIHDHLDNGRTFGVEVESRIVLPVVTRRYYRGLDRFLEATLSDDVVIRRRSLVIVGRRLPWFSSRR